MGFFSPILDVVWPRRCEICGRTADRSDRHVCAECLNRIPFVRPEDGEYEIPDAVSAVRFEDETRRAILDFKFNRHLWLKEDFVDWLEAAVSARFDAAAVDAVVAMPTTVRHRMDRGYNPCALLAASLAKRQDRRFLGKALFRQGNFQRQGGLDEASRKTNVAGTIGVKCAEFVRGRTILVVDDIMTTGSTLAECAKTLKAAGAARVWSVSLARSVRG
jgi:competence protein ComFC